jgi:LytR cell envelope-related transcriptional attenuator
MIENPPVEKFSTLLKKYSLPLGVLLVVLAAVPSVYFFLKYQGAQRRLTNPTQYAQDEVKAVVAEVGKLMILPEGETPTVATVNDKEKLKSQPFFAFAENGDKVLIYTTAKKAILYRPGTHKIIDVAPVNIGANATESAQVAGAQVTATPMPAYKFVLLNGSGVVGVTKRYETELKSKIKSAEITDRDNAKKTNYEKTILIDSTGKRSSEAQSLATTLGITVSSLPAGEATSSGDFVIIIGADKAR